MRHLIQSHFGHHLEAGSARESSKGCHGSGVDEPTLVSSDRSATPCSRFHPD